jgi:hypothetical protein
MSESRMPLAAAEKGGMYLDLEFGRNRKYSSPISAEEAAYMRLESLAKKLPAKS